MNCSRFQAASAYHTHAPFVPTRTIVSYPENSLSQFDIVQGESALRLYKVRVQVPGDLDERFLRLQM
jgi:hypothetical protein